ncbi:MAG: glycosyltransferase [Hydrogenophaga sp.]|nr:glycosyltransferase [Hydrogenophaga sp.]
MAKESTSTPYVWEVGDKAAIAETVKIIADSGAVIKLGARTQIREHAVLESVAGGRIEIGDGSVVGYGSWIHGTGGVSIGSNVLIGPSVAITSTTHRYDLTLPIIDQGLRMAESVIEDDVWIGANVTVTAGSRIGKGAIIAAGSTVRGTIPGGAIAAGNPATVVATRKHRNVLFYLQPLVLRNDPLLFSCIVDRYEPLAKSFENLGWTSHFCGSDELVAACGNNGFRWHGPAGADVRYPTDNWLAHWRSILLGEELSFHARYLERMLDEVQADIVFCWNFDGVLKKICEKREIVVVFNELGLSREPNPLVYYSDPEGVNATASMRRQWLDYADSTAMRADLAATSSLRRDKIVVNYLLTDERRREVLSDYGASCGFILLILQVSDDSNIVAGSPFGSMQAFVDQCVSAVAGSATVVVKPHPAEAPPLKDSDDRRFVIANSAHTTQELIAAADAVFTINSSAGFEAALAGKPVYVLGKAPYGQLGITHDVVCPEHLRELWLTHGKEPAASGEHLDAVACFAYQRYFMDKDTFFDAKWQLARVAHHLRRENGTTPRRIAFADGVEINLLLARVADLEKQKLEYENWVQVLREGQDSAEQALSAAQKSVDEVTRWAHQLQVELKGAAMAGSPARRVAQALRRRYHRLPLPAPLKQFIGFAYRTLLRKPIRLVAGILRNPAASSAGFNAPTWAPAVAAAHTPDYLVWGVIDWHFRQQRPQHMARVIAASGRRVFYISSNLLDNPTPGFSVERLDESGRLFQIRLHVEGAPPIYDKAPGPATVAALRRSIGELLSWADSRSIVSLVQHSFWHGVASVLPNSRLVYDCMDHHEGFGNNGADILALEQQLLRDADLTIATSAWLAELLTPRTAHCHIVRNAGDYQHFARVPDTVFRDPSGRKVIGYIGAIAEWFDIELVEKIARRFADCLVLLVGNDSAGAAARLRYLPNVQLTGEIPYRELPFYVHGFDVCLLPFRIIPLTLATNPVKVYEYLGTGKPVVATALPETLQFGDLIETAASHDAYLDAVGRALAADPAANREARQAFAREQTWNHRARDVVALSEAPSDEPLVSVIVLTYNNLALTQACLTSLDTYSDYPAMEIIVVDNASADGSPDFLRTWAEGGANRKLVLNADNRGFAAGNNQGLEIAQGEYLILLNNDTHVTPGWVHTLVKHMRRDASIGLIGPVTNNIGNEAKIEIAYDDMSQMLERSAAFTRRHIGVTFELPTAAFFCVAMPRAVYAKVGPLDEAFGRGFFEDDDYCRRVEQIGLRIVCAEDVFVHHHLSASFNKLGSSEKQRLFDLNKAHYESKWGAWNPHSHR